MTGGPARLTPQSERGPLLSALPRPQDKKGRYCSAPAAHTRVEQKQWVCLSICYVGAVASFVSALAGAPPAGVQVPTMEQQKNAEKSDYERKKAGAPADCSVRAEQGFAQYASLHQAG